MSHPVLWPRSFFYPIGNTPPVCLTQSIPPEKPANVLLIGCGDPRNILYTLCADPPTQRPVLDFTCCDIEPAIIARNVLLYTLIYDGHPNDRIWDIFYLIKLDQSAFSLLISQCEKLLEICTDLVAWRQSAYHRFLRFSSSHTLSQLRRYWTLYIQTKSLSKAKKAELFSSFPREYNRRFGRAADFVLDAMVKCVDPFSNYAMEALNPLFARYWGTGLVSRSLRDIAAATFINPTIVYSDSFTPSLLGDGCGLHYGSHPLYGFHLTSTFLTATTDITEEQLVSCARLQFRDWCQAFQATVSPCSGKTVIIRLLAADALPFCHTLSHLRCASANTAGLYVSSWTGAELVLDGGDYEGGSCAPTRFDVIEASNLADHVGLLNILISTVPLLAQNSTSTLYTQVVIRKGDTTNFLKLLCADIPTIGLLFGISPVGYIGQFTSSTDLNTALAGESCRERIAWKLPYLSSPVNAASITPSFPDPPSLATILFNIYLQMFADEDRGHLFSQPRPTLFHYHRGTFAALLGLVKSRVQTDWSSVMESLHTSLCTDSRLIMGPNNYQELCCQLHLRGVDTDTVPALSPQRTGERGLFQGWKEVPLVVCLILIVPRKNIKVLEDLEPDLVQSPMFQCHVRGNTFHNIFSSIQVVLGTPTIRGTGQNCEVSISEDTAGWSGTSPAVVSVFIPAFILVASPRIQISLGLHSTPATVVLTVMGRLGLELNLFTADVLDRSAVHVVATRPDRTSVSMISPKETGPSTHVHNPVSVTVQNGRIWTLTSRWNISEEEGASDGALALAKVEHKQVSPCVVEVTVNSAVQKSSKHIVFPFPIEMVQAKPVRIARKSGWIEIEAPVRQFPRISVPTDFATNTFLTKDAIPVVWNIHRINTSLLPVIEVNHANERLARKTIWIGLHCYMAFSEREWALRDQKTATDSVAQVKETLRQFFLHSIQPNAPRVFALFEPSSLGQSYTILYQRSIRMDLASHTLVADTFVLPVTDNTLKVMCSGPSFQFVKLTTKGDEVMAWKHLLVAFTERCRTWNHKSSCKYRKSENLPFSLELFENPLCGCGEGIDVDDLVVDPIWTKLAPFMTRAAISPLFPIFYLEKGNRTCAACKMPETNSTKLSKCIACREVDYCGKDCQKGHWKQHKSACKGRR
ncbi:hypothetical protein C8J57DRAFT_1056186 [Mycena rebaudengoi]|nr:hypothetical protein C8J57DRAFT_1056186 [Mycena rebaudengoi]